MDIRLDHARSQVTKKLRLHRGRTESDVRDTSNIIFRWITSRCIQYCVGLFLLLIFLMYLCNSSLFSSISIASLSNTQTNQFTCPVHMSTNIRIHTNKNNNNQRIDDPKKTRVVVVPDIHGDLLRFRQTLIAAELITTTPPYHWLTNNHDTLVILGDMVDRGPDTKKVLESIMTWSKEAIQNGGQIIPLLGNHELMALSGVQRYVSNQDFVTFGGEEQRKAAFSKQSPLGQWLRCLNLIVTINQDVFVHAGLLPQWITSMDMMDTNKDTNKNTNKETNKDKNIDATIQHNNYNNDYDQDGALITSINDRGRDALLHERWKDPIFKSDGPLWTRLLARGDESKICSILQTTLSKLNVTRMIVGHTRQHIQIGSRCNGQLLLIDTGTIQKLKKIENVVNCVHYNRIVIIVSVIFFLNLISSY